MSRLLGLATGAITLHHRVHSGAGGHGAGAALPAGAGGLLVQQHLVFTNKTDAKLYDARKQGGETQSQK